MITVPLTQEACLADILDLSAGLTNLGLLVPHPGSRTPPEDSKRSEAYLRDSKGEERRGIN